MKKLSFVIPCYGSETTIESVIEEIRSIMSLQINCNYEIIAVNDQSPDNVMRVLMDLASNDEKITIVEFANNKGKHAAILAGYSMATGDYLVNLDDDGQCPLDHLSDLLDALDHGADIAIAKYPVKKQSFIKNFGSSVNSLMSRWLIGKPKGLQISNFSAIKRFIAIEMLKYCNPYPYVDGLFLRSTTNIVNVEMEERERLNGIGNYTIKKSLALWLNGFTAFSVRPLRIASVVGAAIALIGFISGLILIIRKLTINDIISGYSSTMVVLLFIGGIIMMMLGLIGEYVGRIYMSLNKSPQYVIRSIYNKSKEY